VGYAQINSKARRKWAKRPSFGSGSQEGRKKDPKPDAQVLGKKKTPKEKKTSNHAKLERKELESIA